MKNLIAFLVSLLFFTTAYAEGEITVTVDSNPVYFDTPPMIINSRTMVPVRAIFESLGAEVTWDENTRTVGASKEDMKLSMTIGSNLIQFDDKAIIMDTTPIIINNRTLIPARFAAEAFGNSVSWDGDTRTVHILTGVKNDIEYYKKYQNNVLSMMYPYEWHLDETFPDIIFIDNQGDSMAELGMAMVSISQTELFNSSFSDTFSAWYDYKSEGSDISGVSFHNTTVNGYNAIRLDYKDIQGDFITSYMLEGKNKAIFVEFISKNQESFEDIFDVMLSTLSLI